MTNQKSAKRSKAARTWVRLERIREKRLEHIGARQHAHAHTLAVNNRQSVDFVLQHESRSERHERVLAYCVVVRQP